MVQVTHSYRGQHGDELTIYEGEILKILRKMADSGEYASLSFIQLIQSKICDFYIVFARPFNTIPVNLCSISVHVHMHRFADVACFWLYFVLFVLIW